MIPAHVDLDQATRIVAHAEHPIWAHNLRATHRHPTFIETQCRGRRHPTHFTCTVFAWSGQRLILKLPLTVHAIRVKRAHTIAFEDGSAELRYSIHRELIVDPS